MKKVLSCFSLFLMLISFAPLRGELGNKIAAYAFFLDENESKYFNIPIYYPFCYYYGYENQGVSCLKFYSQNNTNTSPIREFITITHASFYKKNFSLNLPQLLSQWKIPGSIQMLPNQEGVEIAHIESDLPSNDDGLGNRMITVTRDILAKDYDASRPTYYFLEIRYLIYCDEGLSDWEKEDIMEDARTFLQGCLVEMLQ